MKFKLLMPLVVFLGVVIFLAIGLSHDPKEIPSPLINKPAPMFNLPQLTQANQIFSPQDMRGQVWILNVWASWCAACREEHPVLLGMAKTGVVPIIGLVYKDQRADALAILERLQNPYQLSAFDEQGRVGIDYGVYGVPETYVIDKGGVIRYKQIGPLTQEALTKKIYPLIAQLQKS